MEDDQGVFATSLSKEFYLVQSAFNLSTLELIRLAGTVGQLLKSFFYHNLIINV